MDRKAILLISVVLIFPLLILVGYFFETVSLILLSLMPIIVGIIYVNESYERSFFFDKPFMLEEERMRAKYAMYDFTPEKYEKRREEDKKWFRFIGVVFIIFGIVMLISFLYKDINSYFS